MSVGARGPDQVPESTGQGQPDGSPAGRPTAGGKNASSVRGDGAVVCGLDGPRAGRSFWRLGESGEWGEGDGELVGEAVATGSVRSRGGHRG